jgi:DNA repair photolyase
MAIIYEPKGRAREYAALAANLYSGCTHGCEYCYVPDILSRAPGEYHQQGQPRPNVLQQLERDARTIGKTDQHPVLLSFSTDPYQPADDQYRLTRSAIEILHQHGICVQVLTKGGTRAVKDFDLLTDQDAFASTLTFTSDEDSKRWEPGAALPADRYAALEEAHGRGIETWVSLEPVVDPEQTLQIILDTHKYVDLFKVGMLNHHAAGARTDWRHFAELAVELLRRLGKDYYLKRDLCEHAGMRYSERPEATRRFIQEVAPTQAALF